ncbi:MAG TPA: nitroreductase [Syntrophaceae bacterium]|nr:nitroreductase [Syntrophaceae bacterium]
MSIPGNIAQILRYASLAPSSHNTQPWRVKIISELEFIIQSDPKRWLLKVDPENREFLLSIGAFWENLEQAALTFGFKAKTEILATNSKNTDILKVKLVRCTPQKDNRLELIETRATNRRPYEKKDLLPLHVKELKRLLPDHFTYFSRESKEGEWIAKSLIEANKKQTFDDEKQKELARWLRFSRFEVKKRGDGITPEMLGVSGIAKFFWYTFMNGKSVLSWSFRNKGVENVKNQVNNCAGFIVITSDDLSVSSLLHAGKVFERLALKCTERGIAVHPMSQLIEESPWKVQIEELLGLSKPVQFVLRVGYSTFQPKPSIQRPIEEFTDLR